MRTEDFTNNYFQILEETFESPSPEGGFYLDKQTGWLETLDRVSAAQASRLIPGGNTTIAGQVNHVRFYLEALEGYMTGRITGKTDWQESWQVHEVAPQAWDELRRALAAAYERVKTHLKAVPTWDDDGVTDALAIVVHSAYHLGAVRQMVQASG